MASIFEEEIKVISSKPIEQRYSKISDVLINTTKKQILSREKIFNSYSEMFCAKGILADYLGLGLVHYTQPCSICFTTPDGNMINTGKYSEGMYTYWDKLLGEYGLSNNEILKSRHCPRCVHTFAIGDSIIHMNDTHRMTFKEIGKTLQGWGL